MDVTKLIKYDVVRLYPAGYPDHSVTPQNKQPWLLVVGWNPQKGTALLRFPNNAVLEIHGDYINENTLTKPSTQEYWAVYRSNQYMQRVADRDPVYQNLIERFNPTVEPETDCTLPLLHDILDAQKRTNDLLSSLISHIVDMNTHLGV